MNTGKTAKAVIQLIADLKSDFREWYGSISIEEIMSNQELVKHIERVEQILIKSAR